MKPRTPQPNWLTAFSWNYAHGETIEVWMDGDRFAILKFPGHTWSDNSGSHYGCVMFYLHDKTKLANGIARLGTMIHEGRLKKTDAARLRKMCEQSNECNELVILKEGQ